jgi:hypothetical protein
LLRITVVIFFIISLLAACDLNVSKFSQKDVTFFGTGKVSRYQQTENSSLELLEPLFFAEIFITDGGTVKNAMIKFPGINDVTEELKYRYSESDEIGDVMYLSGFAENYEDLEKKYPMGDYAFSFVTSEGEVKNSIVSYKDRTFPVHPIISLKQENNKIAIDEVNPAKELIISWPKFNEGRADKNGLLDDPIFVAIDSCNIEDIIHSGRPFEKKGYLTYRTSQFIVPKDTFEVGQKYSMYVEHAIFTDTHDNSGMPAFATLASSTYMDFMTLGITDTDYCKE